MDASLYERASYTRRALAQLLDWVAIVGLGYAGTYVGSTARSTLDARSAPNLDVPLGIALCVGYFTVAFALWGTTPAMRVLDLSVLALDGSLLRWPKALARTLGLFATWVVVLLGVLSVTRFALLGILLFVVLPAVMLFRRAREGKEGLWYDERLGATVVRGQPVRRSDPAAAAP